MKLFPRSNAVRIVGRRYETPRALKPRSNYPSLSIHPLHRSPWAKLAWIFDFTPWRR